ncbi:hypothetical protein C8J57DRAFT_1498469 [Mycena rebaudengoi]|nr:hypothetical protein C8J57DRAFT_1498469 [Mycena rebaudengoi]
MQRVYKGSSQLPILCKSCTLSSSAYVLSLAVLSSFYAASASAPANTIDLFDKSTFRGHTLPGHELGTTSLRAVPRVAFNKRGDYRVAVSGNLTLVSSGLDGSIKVWDERTTSHAIKRGASCASRARLRLRQPAAPLHTQLDTSDDVAVVLPPLRPERPPLRVTHQRLRDRRRGGTTKILAARRHSTWSDELDPLRSEDIRAPTLHTHHQHTWVTDYLITCRAPVSDAVADALGVFVGSNEGDVALLTSPMDPGAGAPPWTLRNVWATATRASCARFCGMSSCSFFSFPGSAWRTALTPEHPPSSILAPGVFLAILLPFLISFFGAWSWLHTFFTFIEFVGLTYPPLFLPPSSCLPFHVLLHYSLLIPHPPTQNNTLLMGDEDGKINVWVGSSSSSATTAPADDAMDVDGDLPAGRRRREWDEEQEEQEGGKRARR